METSNTFRGSFLRIVFALTLALACSSVSAFPLPPAGTPMFGDPQLQACFDEQAQANGWVMTEDVTELVCPDREIRDLNGLGVFTDLRALDLGGNLLEVAFPIDQLRQLEVLDLSHNRLWDIIPLNSLSNLRELYLSGNRSPGQGAPGIDLAAVNQVILNNIGLTHLGVGGVPMENLFQLAIFDFAQNRAQYLLELDISRTGVLNIDALSDAPNLRVLKAGGNRLDFANINDPLHQLQELDLSDNALIDIYQLRFLQALTQLNLSGNSRLDAGDVQSVVFNNPGLTHLYLADIQLHDLNWLPSGPPGVFDLVEIDVSRTGQLFHLDSLIRYPNLRLLRAAGSGLRDLWSPNYLTQVEVLDLEDNNLNGIYALAYLNNLAQLDLSGNSALQPNEVAAVVQSNPGLTHLGLSAIAMGDLDWLPSPGPQGEFNLQELKISRIGDLGFLGPVSQYPDLRVLEAAGNRLQMMWGSNELAGLEALDVSDNRLLSLYELQFNTGLEQLNLSGNRRLPLNEVQTVVQNNPGLTRLGLAEISLDNLQWLPPVGPRGEFDLVELDISNSGDFFDLGPVGQYQNLRVLRAAGIGLRTAFAINQLPWLEELDLSNNELADIFGLQSLTQLRRLNLSNNRKASLTYPGIELVTLNQVLTNNPEITHLGAAGVPIGDLDQLAVLDLYNQASSRLLELDVSNTGIDYIGPVSSAINLRVLRAADNQIDYIYPLQGMSQLQVLDLSRNRLYDIVALQNLAALRELYLSGNSRLQFAEVQNAVQANPGLTHLGLADIALPGLTWLPPKAPGAYDLVSLDVSNTGDFSDLGPLQSYHNLRELKAAGNGLYFVFGIEQMTRLEVLDLGHNRLLQVNALFGLDNLRQLDLSENTQLLSGEVQDLVMNNPGLTHLAVAGIAFNDTAWLPAPGPQGEFDLVELDISNSFSALSLTNVSVYTRLRVLRAAGNGVEYVVAIDQLNRLEELDLSDNQLNDASQLAALQNLRRLNLSGNGALQLNEVKTAVLANPELTHLGVAGIAMLDLNWLPQGEFNLQDLDVSNTGLIDLGMLSRFPGLRVLRAAGNQLDYLYFGQRMDIEVLDLSHNKFWDVFALSDLEHLRELYLSGNQPSESNVPGVDLATINQAINNNPGLTHLGIGGVAIGDLSQLAIFDSANLVGQQLVQLDISNAGIVDAFRINELAELRILDVSGNQIFETLQFSALQKLVDLDLSDNELGYVMPLGDMLGLARLDLRGNVYIQCAELDELEFRLNSGVLIRPATCIFGNPPTIDILWPAPGLGFYATELISLQAAAGDIEDGDLGAQVQWSSDLDGPLGSGALLDLSLTAGNHVITASVVDSDGNTASQSVELLIIPNTAPALTIDSVQNGALFQAGDLVTLGGTATDAEEGNISPAIQWHSSLDGPLGNGASIQVPLGVGEHTISASITDEAGATATATVTLRINDAPQLSLQSPLDNSVFQQGETIEFAGSASDLEDGDLGGFIQWQSDLDGALGSGAQLSLALGSLGEHRITASITDNDGATVTQTARVFVNGLPQLDLLAPADGDLFMLQQAVTLSASASDPEDGDISAAIAWSSNLDGELGSGGSLSIDSLSLGTHTISASITDSAGGMQTLTTQIVVDQIDLQVTVSGSGSRQKATLTWSGARTDVDVYKNGKIRRVRGPSGTTRFRFRNEAVFKVCETGTDYCSPDVTVQINQ